MSGNHQELHNEHVILYYRFRAWLGEILGKPWAAMFNRQWAEWERDGWPKEFTKE